MNGMSMILKTFWKDSEFFSGYADVKWSDKKKAVLKVEIFSIKGSLFYVK